jgi:hypothetical protein
MNAPSTQVSTMDETDRQIMKLPQATGLLEAISRAASDPAMDIEKVERLFKMHEALQRQQAETAFNTALANAQAEMSTVIKNRTNEFTRTRYADLDTIINCISPIYTAHGFAVSFNTEDCPDKAVLRVVATLSHSGGHSRQYKLDAPLDDAGSGGKVTKTKIQATGSTNSYARRYLICMIFNVTTADDNDGNNNAKAGIAQALNPRQRETVQKIASRMHKHLAANEVADAVSLGEGSDLDAEEQIFLFTFFNAPQRNMLKKVSAELRKAKVITDAQRTRLEARIGELGLDRESVKGWCAEKFGKEHFADLSRDEYNELDSALESMAPAQATPLDAPQDSTAALATEPSHEDLGQGVPADASTPTDEELVSDIAVWVKKGKFDMAYDLCRGITHDALKDSTKARIDKAKSYVDAKQSAA